MINDAVETRILYYCRCNNRDTELESSLTSDALNRQYADISTDQDYIPAKRKLTAVGADDYSTEYDVFHMLDRLKPTATGLDSLPVWFLRVSAPIVAAALAVLLNHSISTGVVPRQWKNAIITPVPKVSVPTEAIMIIDYYLSRLVERRIVRRYIYPALNNPPRVLTLQTNMPLGQRDRLQLPLLLSITLFVLCCLVTSMFEFLYLTFQKHLTV